MIITIFGLVMMFLIGLLVGIALGAEIQSRR